VECVESDVGASRWIYLFVSNTLSPGGLSTFRSATRNRLLIFFIHNRMSVIKACQRLKEKGKSHHTYTFATTGSQKFNVLPSL
jgi:hypothetical protein